MPSLILLIPSATHCVILKLQYSVSSVLLHFEKNPSFSSGRFCHAASHFPWAIKQGFPGLHYSACVCAVSVKFFPPFLHHIFPKRTTVLVAGATEACSQIASPLSDPRWDSSGQLWALWDSSGRRIVWAKASPVNSQPSPPGLAQDHPMV